jgi:hypothetical protein
MRVVPLERLQQFAAVNLLLDPGAIPGPVVIPSCAQITLVWQQQDGKLAHNVLYGRYTGTFAGTVAMCDAILTGLTTGTAWLALTDLLATETVLSAVHMRDVNFANQPILESTGPGAAGAGAANAMPNEMAVCVTLRTAQSGQQFRGRMYLPGFTEANNVPGNVMGAGTIQSVNAWVGTIAGILSAQGFIWVIGQKARQAYTGITGRDHPARPANSVPITAAVVRDNHWDTQRRRGLK